MTQYEVRVRKNKDKGKPWMEITPLGYSGSIRGVQGYCRNILAFQEVVAVRYNRRGGGMKPQIMRKK